MKKFAPVIALSSLFFGTVTATIASASELVVKSNPVTIVQVTQQEESNAKQTVENDDLKFQLQGCQRKAKQVNCYFNITNTANADRGITLWAGNRPSRIIDVDGNEYTPKTVQIGKSQGGYAAETKLLPGISMKASLSFEISQEVTKLAVLEVSYFAGNFSKVEFRNIDIIGSGSNSVSSTRITK
jgi:hypothetical protein